MIKLHHAPKDLGGKDIPVSEFDSIEALHAFFESLAQREMTGNGKGNYKASDTVYLFTYAEDGEVIVSEKIYFIADLLSKWYFFGFDLVTDFFLQEYESYEEAYSVALDMKEVSPLCYSK